MQETCLKPPLFSINHHVNEHMNLNWWREPKRRHPCIQK
jgi:hypothetical protein